MTSDRKRNDGGPAYPRTGEGFGNPRFDAPGMSLRDWFAGQALLGIHAAGATSNNEEGWEWAAHASYAQADAMLKAREAKQ